MRRFRHAHSGGTVVEFHNLPYYFLKEILIFSSKKPEILSLLFLLQQFSQANSEAIIKQLSNGMALFFRFF